MKRPEPKQAASIKDAGQADEAFAKRYPTILMYMLDVVWDDGKDRVPSALALTVEGGMWQAALNDKALKQSFYTKAATMAEALKLMEKALAEGVDAWRPWKRGK